MGLFSKTRRAPKAVPYQADKCSEPFDLIAGMVVEVYKEGRWQVGEVEDTYIDLFDPPYYNLAGFDEYPVRKLTSEGAVRAKEHYHALIKDQEALINHDKEKSLIDEYQERVNGLVPLDQDTSKGSSKKPPLTQDMEKADG